MVFPPYAYNHITATILARLIKFANIRTGVSDNFISIIDVPSDSITEGKPVAIEGLIILPFTRIVHPGK
jgi:hypothetical protein